jgi:FkbM family methyltransferase
MSTHNVTFAGRTWKWVREDRSNLKYMEKHWQDAVAPLKHVPMDRRKVCVQAGGNFGVWPYFLSEHFDQLVTFEPEPEVNWCMRKNLASRDNISIFNTGLGAENTRATIIPAEGRNKGAQWLKFGEGDIPVTTLDSLNMTGLDYLQLDIEGAEPFALEGAKETIAKFRPIICVEKWESWWKQKNCEYPGHEKVNYGLDQTAGDWLVAHGYKEIDHITQDRIYAPV